MEEVLSLNMKLMNSRKESTQQEKQIESLPQDLVESKKNILNDIKNFNKENLTETETQVHTVPVVNQNQTGYGHSSEEEIKEYFDSEEDLVWKIKELAEVIRNTKHLVVYTGAGVSTSAKIPDYRGPNGVWTLRDKGLVPKFDITIEQALPTPTHMALTELEKCGILKYLVSTNVDGLHRRSGIPEKAIAELHGNCFKEVCESCSQEYLRSFDVAKSDFQHKTGRVCEINDCNGSLKDTIINFGENLPQKEIDLTTIHSKMSDVSFVLGTSMRVSPACNFPTVAAKNGGKMIIVNLQVTPFDSLAYLVIRERTDKVMQLLFKELGMSIPEYTQETDIIFLMKQGLVGKVKDV